MSAPDYAELVARIDSAIRFGTPVPECFLREVRAALERAALLEHEARRPIGGYQPAMLFDRREPITKPVQPEPRNS